MSDFCNSKQVVTRKHHRCEWCGEAIEMGAKCQYASGRFDGDMYSYHAHPECWQDLCACPDVALDGFMPHQEERPKALDMCALKEGI